MQTANRATGKKRIIQNADQSLTCRCLLVYLPKKTNAQLVKCHLSYSTDSELCFKSQKV